MNIATRKTIIIACVIIFFLLGAMVYLDTTSQKNTPLSKLARKGEKIWQQHNCQSCHRLYGYGGFLGPDLTNAVEHFNKTQLDIILTEGSGQMPAFHLPSDDRKAIIAFLAALNETGRGLPSHNNSDKNTYVAPNALFKKVIKLTFKYKPLSKEASTGRDIVFAKGCISCHLPNHHGLRAPDLTQLNRNFQKKAILKALVDGVPGKMPAFRLSYKERKAVLAFLISLEKNATKIEKGFQTTRAKKTFKNTPIPWFEYE